MKRPDITTVLEPIVDSRDTLGEGPIWDARESVLWWTDIEGQRIHHAKADGSAHQFFELGVKVGAIGLCEGEGLVLATAQGFAKYAQGTLNYLGNPLEPGDEVRFNDGIVDPLGRFWAGSLGGRDNSLFVLDGETVTRFQGGFGLPNGMGFSPDERTLYFTDSEAKTIYAYDFDPRTGQAENRRPLIVTQDEDGVPDGLTVDAQGFVWSARWGGWHLSRYDPEGRLERTVELPVEQPTSCAFGGEELASLFVTSAREGLDEGKLREQPLAGSLLGLEPSVKGKLEYRFKG